MRILFYRMTTCTRNHFESIVLLSLSTVMLDIKIIKSVWIIQPPTLEGSCSNLGYKWVCLAPQNSMLICRIIVLFCQKSHLGLLKKCVIDWLIFHFLFRIQLTFCLLLLKYVISTESVVLPNILKDTEIMILTGKAFLQYGVMPFPLLMLKVSS